MSVYLDIKLLYPHLKVNWNMLMCKICIARHLVVDIFPWCSANFVPFPSGTLVARRMRNGRIAVFDRQKIPFGTILYNFNPFWTDTLSEMTFNFKIIAKALHPTMLQNYFKHLSTAPNRCYGYNHTCKQLFAHCTGIHILKATYMFTL